MIDLERIARRERPELERLVDDYLAELGEHREIPVGPTDAASYQYLPLYWEEPGRHPLFLVSAGVRVGFVLVREVVEENVIEMSEFYVLPGFRRSGLGRAALEKVWERFPGAWKVQVHPLNRAGSHFWPRCIAEFAEGEIERRDVVEEDGRRVEYRFEIAPA